MSVAVETPPPCEVCDSADWRVLFRDLVDRIEHGPGTFVMWECEGCKTGRIWPVPDDLSAYYPASYPAFQSGASAIPKVSRVRRAAWAMTFSSSKIARVLASTVLARTGPVPDVRRFAPGPSFSLLDVGCGSGQLLSDAQSVGIEVQGLELSEHGAAAARARGVPCVCGELKRGIFPENSFDVVRLAHVLEHVPSPLETVRAIREILRPGGALVVMVPNKASLGAALFGPDWYPIQAPAHLWHFSADSLAALLHRAGFVVESSECLTWGGCLYHSMRFFLESRDSDLMPLEMPADAAGACDATMGYLDRIGMGDALHVVARMRADT